LTGQYATNIGADGLNRVPKLKSCKRSATLCYTGCPVIQARMLHTVRLVNERLTCIVISHRCGIALGQKSSQGTFAPRRRSIAGLVNESVIRVPYGQQTPSFELSSLHHLLEAKVCKPLTLASCKRPCRVTLACPAEQSYEHECSKKLIRPIFTALSNQLKEWESKK